MSDDDELEAMMREAAEPNEIISSPITITYRDFEKIIKKCPLIVIDCWDVLCGPCRMIASTIDAMAKDYAGKIVFEKLNVDENPMTSRRYRILSIPALLIFKNG